MVVINMDSTNKLLALIALILIKDNPNSLTKEKELLKKIIQEEFSEKEFVDKWG